MPIKILLAHNYYQQSGGEDLVFAAEGNLLREKGHDVIEYIEHNDRIRTMGRLDVALHTLGFRDSYKKVSYLLTKEKPDIAHFHNTFPLISPAAYYACYDHNIPVVQSLHNFRLLCPAATLYREGHICEDCLGKSIAWPGILHKCYHESHTQTAVISAMISTHNLLGTWGKKVDIYIAGTEFMRQKFILGGLPGEKIVVKPNFITVNNVQRGKTGDFALFVGRLVTEKGVQTLLKSWKSLKIPLKIVGDGPLQDMVIDFLKENRSLPVEYLGKLERKAVQSLLYKTRFLVFPSEWYEAFPMIIIDAFLSGVPVIASRLGAAEKIIENEFSGLYFDSGNSADLVTKVQWAWEHPLEMAQMGKNARHEYEEKYTADKNYEMLIDIYQHAIATRKTLK
jgi:glycosyltransferase involved in cell wall biosynthesis